MKIAVGLSGGVDSTITAHLLKKQGHEVVGITMKIWDGTYTSSNTSSSCFGPDEKEDLEETKRITEKLGIPLYIIDLAKEYNKNIIGYFKEEYLAGRTPNPCIKCNQMMKFNFLLSKAKDQGVDFEKFATGHYANIEYNETTKRYLLKKGLDPKKDQSYFLSLLKQEQLSQVIFPLGSYNKEQVKEIAKEMPYLKVHEKKESQDFYSGEYEELLDKLPDKGNIIDTTGKILGTHKGICFYTIGQRKGLGVSHSEPLYVIQINKFDNTVVVGTEKNLYKDKFTVSNVNWIAIENLTSPIKAKTKIRYMHKEDDAEITPLDNDKVEVRFEKPQRAIAPGQFSVFYDNDTVIGGGIID